MAEFLISAFADETSNDPDHQIAALKRNGLRMIEPRNIGGGIVDRTDAELDAFADKLDRAGIGISALGSPIGKYDIDKPFDAHMTDFRRALEVCRRLGTDRMRMFSFFVPQERLKECRAEVLRRLSVMLEEADRAFLGQFARRRSGLVFYLKNRALVHGFFRLAGMIALG